MVGKVKLVKQILTNAKVVRVIMEHVKILPAITRAAVILGMQVGTAKKILTNVQLYIVPTMVLVSTYLTQKDIDVIVRKNGILKVVVVIIQMIAKYLGRVCMETVQTRMEVICVCVTMAGPVKTALLI